MTRYCWRCGAVLGAVPPTTCATCGEVHYLNPKPCGDAVVVRDGPSGAPDREILLVLRARDPDAGCWDVPGGFCEAAEHPRDAAERELTEETGLRGRAFAYVGTWIHRYGPPDPDGLSIHSLISTYLVRLDDPGATPRPDPAETLEVRWFGLSALPERMAFPRYERPMIAAAAELLRSGAGQPLLDRP